MVLLLHTMADQECARGGGVSHILAEKRLLASLYSKNMHENAIFSPIRGGGGVRRVGPMLDPPLTYIQTHYLITDIKMMCYVFLLVSIS